MPTIRNDIHTSEDSSLVAPYTYAGFKNAVVILIFALLAGPCFSARSARADGRPVPDKIDRVAALTGDRSVERSEAWQESRLYLQQAINLGQRAVSLERKGDYQAAFNLDNQAYNAASMAEDAYLKRKLPKDVPADVEFLKGASMLDLARIEIIVYHEPTAYQILEGKDPKTLVESGLRELRDALRREEFIQSILPTSYRVHQIEAIKTAIARGSQISNKLAGEEETARGTPAGSSSQFSAAKRHSFFEKLSKSFIDQLKGEGGHFLHFAIDSLIKEAGHERF